MRGGEPVQVFPLHRGMREERKGIRRGEQREGGTGALCKFKLRRVKRDSHSDNTELVKLYTTFTWLESTDLG